MPTIVHFEIPPQMMLKEEGNSIEISLDGKSKNGQVNPVLKIWNIG
jgi:hypothetical protein